MFILWIVQTVSRLFGQFLDYLDSFWIIRIVSGFSVQFLDSPDIFWIVWKVYGISGKFLDYPDSFLIFWSVSGLSGKFLDCPDSFWIVRTVSVLSRQFLDRYELKGTMFTLLQKLSGCLQKLSRQQCCHTDKVFLTLRDRGRRVLVELAGSWK